MDNNVNLLIKFNETSPGEFIDEDEEVFTNSEIALKCFLHKYRFEMYKDYVERVVLKEKVEEL